MKKFSTIIPAVFLLAMVVFPSQAFAEPLGQVIYFKHDYCPWCRIFDDEVMGIFNKTKEGKEVPITKVDLKKDLDKFPVIAKTIHYVPTFVVLDREGKERGRIFGYSRNFFWPNLEKIVKPIRDNLALEGKQPVAIDKRKCDAES
ncbi:MAG: hypothetical protein HQL70_09215 [Magnetococcales bacterium]|nr:hypothetical protein [Magnetococcales bacterium]